MPCGAGSRGTPQFPDASGFSGDEGDRATNDSHPHSVGMNRRQRRGHGPPTLPLSYPGEEAWWKWAGVPRFRRRGEKFSRNQRRDILKGVLAGSGILLAALLLIFGVIWLVQR
jgi:hypothetical protein